MTDWHIWGKAKGWCSVAENFSVNVEGEYLIIRIKTEYAKNMTFWALRGLWKFITKLI
jgi:hypothetical protein